MQNEFDWKKFEFITTVQTGLISNGIDRSLSPDAIEKRAAISPPTVLFQMHEAFRAAEMIPESVSARTAAWEFTMWTISHDHDPGATRPEWYGPPSKEEIDNWN